MPQGRQQCCRWLHTISSSNQGSVWISDDVLKSAFRSFLETSKPHRHPRRSSHSNVTSCNRRRTCLDVSSRLWPTAESHKHRNEACARRQHLVTNTPKRYASAVPGPLEARRRSSKRKNASLVQAGNAATSIDPGVVLGYSKPKEWWIGRPPPPVDKFTDEGKRSSLQEDDKDIY